MVSRRELLYRFTTQSNPRSGDLFLYWKKEIDLDVLSSTQNNVDTTIKSKTLQENSKFRWLNSLVLSNSDEKYRRNDFVGKKVRQKFVTSSDKNPRETDGYISDEKPTIRFVGIYFIGNLSDTFPTAVIIRKRIPTKYICRKFLTKDVRWNILTHIFHRKCPTTIRLELSENFPTKYLPSVIFIYNYFSINCIL